MRPIALLSLWQLRNAVRTTLTEPRKFIPLLVFFGVIGFQTVLYFMAGPNRAVPPSMLPEMLDRYGASAHAIVFLVLVVGSLGFLETGFTGGALAFSPADIDYLFPSPVPRRVVLAYHLPALYWKYLMQAGVFLWLGYLVLWRAVGSQNVHGGGWVLLLSLMGWLAGYANLAVSIEIVFGRGRAPLARKLSLSALLLLAAWVAFLVWRNGLAGVAAIERNLLMQVLFFPARLLADAFLAPVTGRSALGGTVILLAFFALSLWLVLTRRQNFYETTLPHSEKMARIRKAAREGNVGAILAMQTRERAEKTERAEKPRRGMERSRPYVIRPFGRGAVAVLWANLSAAAKRPWVNFIGPLLGGLAVSVAALVWAGDEAPYVTMFGVAYASYLMLTISSRNAFRQALERQSLMRPMPIAPWKLVMAEVVPVVLSAALFGWGAALPLAITSSGGGTALSLPVAIHHPGRLIAAIAVFSIPVGLLDLCLINYTVIVWYPVAQDKFQQMIGGFVAMALLGAYVLALVPFVAVPLVLRAGIGMTVAVATFGALLLAPGLAAIAAHALRRLQPA